MHLHYAYNSSILSVMLAFISPTIPFFLMFNAFLWENYQQFIYINKINLNSQVGNLLLKFHLKGSSGSLSIYIYIYIYTK